MAHLKLDVESEEIVLKEEKKASKEHLKPWSSCLAPRQRQIKTALRFYLTPVRMTKVHKTPRPDAGEDLEEKEPSFSVSRIANCTTTRKSMWRILKN